MTVVLQFHVGYSGSTNKPSNRGHAARNIQLRNCQFEWDAAECLTGLCPLRRSETMPISVGLRPIIIVPKIDKH